MKKFIAILLVLGMLIPMGIGASATEAQADVKPFYFVNNLISDFGFDNVFERINFSTRKYTDDGSILPVYMNMPEGGTLTDIPSMAMELEDRFADRPEGTRYIMLYKTIDTNVQPEAMVYMEEGVRLYAEWAEEFFKAYHDLGGKLDGILLDVEYSASSAYYLYKAYRSGATIINDDGQETEIAANPKIYREIVDHPLYATEIRPLLEERGFTFTEDSGNESEIFKINDHEGKDAAIWDAVMKHRQIYYMEKAIEPALKYYPDVMVTNYMFAPTKAWNQGVNAVGGNIDYTGTTANQNYYVRRPLKPFHDTSEGFSKPTVYNGAIYEDTVYNSFLYEVNAFKDMHASSDNKRVSAFIAGFNYLHRNRPANSTRITPYYSETILHIGMMNPEVFLGYIREADSEIEGEPYDYEAAITVVSELMSELTRVAGAADRKAISVPTQWNSGFTLSGMYAGGRNIWRLTPDTTEMKFEDFKVEGTDPTFKINGQTITFPQGKIVEDSKISHIGTCGYWIETPADVTPIVTSDADRYREFPAFEEDFESYEIGKDYNYYDVEFPTTWQVQKKKNATAVIEEDKNTAGNKVLALTGDFTMKNVKITGNVSAGDTYAENQAWEVTVTLPADMGAEAEITLLSIHDEKGKLLFDGGFQIAGGKLSYYNADKYVELAGVDVSAGGKFTFKRSMDLNTEDAFTCDYTVYDADGKELTTVKDVPVGKKVKAPVQAIGLDFSKVNGTVYVDDYKLYADGTATDFMLYDEKTGIQVAELDKARAANTAYRLSWLNGTASEKVYSVVAAYYNGDKLVEEKVIQEVKMAPNTDAVATGVVEVAEGQSVCVYLRNDNKTEEPGNDVGTPGDTEPGDTTDPAGEVPVMLIAIIAGAVVLVAAIVVIIVVAGKNKKAAPAAEETKDESAE